MASYYYLGAQLPYLSYGQNVPMSSAAFKELALKHLSAADAAVLEQCTLDPDMALADAGDSFTGMPPETGVTPNASSAMLDTWKEWERALRLNLAKNRGKKLKREGGFPTDVPDTPFDAAVAAKTALTIESPLEAEVFLDKARWDVIDNLQGLDIFNETAIFAYMLKLLLMERRMSFNTEEGYTEYKGLYAAILGEPK